MRKVKLNSGWRKKLQSFEKIYVRWTHFFSSLCQIIFSSFYRFPLAVIENALYKHYPKNPNKKNNRVTCTPVKQQKNMYTGQTKHNTVSNYYCDNNFLHYLCNIFHEDTINTIIISPCCCPHSREGRYKAFRSYWKPVVFIKKTRLQFHCNYFTYLLCPNICAW